MSILVFEHEQDFGPSRLGRVLNQYGHRLNIARLWAGDACPPDLDDVQAVVSLGGVLPMTEALKAPWHAGESTLIKAAHQRDLPVVGVGTGSLIVAAALGGVVGPLTAGASEIGWREAKMSFAGTVDPILSGQPWKSMQFVWQSEQVTKPPAGGAGLSGTKLCRMLMWRAGVRTYGFQQPFELDSADIQRLSQRHAGLRQAAGLTHDQLMVATREFMPGFDRLGERLCRCLADYLLAPPLRRCS